jgi:hypothetical protein
VKRLEKKVLILHSYPNLHILLREIIKCHQHEKMTIYSKFPTNYFPSQLKEIQPAIVIVDADTAYGHSIAEYICLNINEMKVISLTADKNKNSKKEKSCQKFIQIPFVLEEFLRELV